MGLFNTAYLEIDDGGGRRGVFELRNINISNSSLTKNYLMGERGQVITEIDRLTDDLLDFRITETRSDRRTGTWIDFGVGIITIDMTFNVGVGDDVQWGDGSGGDGPDNVTRFDASGVDVKPLTRYQIMRYWVGQTKSDSLGYTRLHWGEWTDGSYDDYRDGEYVSVDSGAFGEPMILAIQELDMNKDAVSSFEGSLSAARVAPSSGALEDTAEYIKNNISVDEIDYLQGGG